MTLNGTPNGKPVEELTALGLGDEELAAWRETSLPVDAWADWLTDRVARRPSGSRARQVYGDPSTHQFARDAILEALALHGGDHLLDIGCGGGSLLLNALALGARATGLDHSEAMVVLARERVPRADLVIANADHLPFPVGTFSAVSMSMVFLFFDDPIGVLRECHRVLSPEGRLASYTIAQELRGTPAAPEPLANKSHFYTDAQLVDLAQRAGLSRVRVGSDGGGQLLTAVA